METICRLKDIYKALYNFEKEFAETNGITINEGMVLCCMKDGQPHVATNLCEFVGLSNSRVSRIINSVESKGFIMRQIGVEDKRQMVFTLTDQGRQKIEEMMRKDLDLSDLKTQLAMFGE